MGRTKCILLLLLVSACMAQSDVVRIENIELRLGMTQVEVLNRLGESRKLMKTSGLDNAWCIQDQNPCDHVVQFSGGRLTSVHKSVGDIVGETAATVMANLYTAVSAASIKPGAFRTAASIKSEQVTSRIDGKEWRVRMITLGIGEKDFVIQVFQPIGAQQGAESYVAISEELFKFAATESSVERRSGK